MSGTATTTAAATAAGMTNAELQPVGLQSENNVTADGKRMLPSFLCTFLVTVSLIN